MFHGSKEQSNSWELHPIYCLAQTSKRYQMSKSSIHLDLNKYCKIRWGTETASIPITIYLLFMKRIICQTKEWRPPIHPYIPIVMNKKWRNKGLCLLSPCDWINLSLSSSVQLKSLCQREAALHNCWILIQQLTQLFPLQKKKRGQYVNISIHVSHVIATLPSYLERVSGRWNK